MDNEAIQEIIAAGQKLIPLEPYYSYYFYVLWTLSTSLTILSLYIMFVKNHIKINAEYRPLFAHSMVASALVLTLVALWQPVTVPRYFGGYSIGPLKRFAENGYLFGQWLTWSLAAHIGSVITFSFLIQCYHMKLFGHNRLGDLFDLIIQRKQTWLVTNLLALFNGVLVFLPHVAIKYTALDVKSIPELQDFLSTHPSFILMPISNNYAFLFVTLVSGSVMSIQFFLCIIANLLTLRAIRSTSGIVCQKTLGMQLSMYRLFTLRLLLIISFLYVAVLALMLHIFEVFHFVYFPMLCICFMALYCPTTAMVGFVGLPPIRKSLRTAGFFFRPSDHSTSRIKQLSSNRHVVEVS